MKAFNLAVIGAADNWFGASSNEQDQRRRVYCQLVCVLLVGASGKGGTGRRA